MEEGVEGGVKVEKRGVTYARNWGVDLRRILV